MLFAGTINELAKKNSCVVVIALSASSGTTSFLQVRVALQTVVPRYDLLGPETRSQV